jgi:hypothetical protein
MIPLEKMSDEDFELHALVILRRELHSRPHQGPEGATIEEIMAEVERRDKPAA